MVMLEGHRLNLTGPSGSDGKARIDFSKIVMREVRHPFGVPTYELPPPFSDLQLSAGEELTPTKAARLIEAAAFFGALVHCEKD